MRTTLVMGMTVVDVTVMGMTVLDLIPHVDSPIQDIHDFCVSLFQFILSCHQGFTVSVERYCHHGHDLGVLDPYTVDRVATFCSRHLLYFLARKTSERYIYHMVSGTNPSGMPKQFPRMNG